MMPATRPTTTGREPRWLFWCANPSRAVVLAFVTNGLLAAGALALHGTGVLGWHAAVRVTAAFAFPLWLLTFTASALAQLAPNATTRALRRRRRALGLGYATAQYVHGATILLLARIEPAVLEPGLTVLGGGVGFVMIAAMAATSNDAAVRALGARAWRRLHGLGQLTLAIVYLTTYGGRVAEDAAFWPALALLLLAFALRGAAALQRSRRSTMLPTE